MYRYRQSNNSGCGCKNRTNQENNVTVNIQNNDMEDRCQCGFNDPSVFPENYMYGQSYVPIQYMTTTFKPCVGLKMGTIFPELVSPYEPCQSMAENRFLREATANEGRCPNAI